MIRSNLRSKDVNNFLYIQPFLQVQSQNPSTSIAGTQAQKSYNILSYIDSVLQKSKDKSAIGNQSSPKILPERGRVIGRFQNLTNNQDNSFVPQTKGIQQPQEKITTISQKYVTRYLSIDQRRQPPKQLINNSIIIENQPNEYQLSQAEADKYRQKPTQQNTQSHAYVSYSYKNKIQQGTYTSLNSPIVPSRTFSLNNPTSNLQNLVLDQLSSLSNEPFMNPDSLKTSYNQPLQLAEVSKNKTDQMISQSPQSSLQDTYKPITQNQSPNPQQASDDSKNLRYDGYIIMKFLGKGKFSDVYQAKQIKSNMLVALKVIQKAQIKEKNMENAILWEIKIQHLLRHPYIVQLYTFFQTKSEIVLVLEYCPDGQLFEYLRSRELGRLNEKEAAIFIKQVGSAIAFLHQQDVIHRDIKPENILLSYGQCKLADFSFCIYSPSDVRKTQCGSMVYSSPEIVKGETYDKKCDIWSLGVLAYELCEGQTPWEDLSREETMTEIKTAQIAFPQYFSKELKQFIDALTKKQARERVNARQVLYLPWITQVKELSELSIKQRFGSLQL